MPTRVLQSVSALVVLVAAGFAGSALGVDIGVTTSPVLSLSTGLSILFTASYGITVAHLLTFGRNRLRRKLPAAWQRWLEPIGHALGVFAAVLLLGWLFHAVV
jgi:hypothetical protein